MHGLLIVTWMKCVKTYLRAHLGQAPASTATFTTNSLSSWASITIGNSKTNLLNHYVLLGRSKVKCLCQIAEKEKKSSQTIATRCKSQSTTLLSLLCADGELPADNTTSYLPDSHIEFNVTKLIVNLPYFRQTSESTNFRSYKMFLRKIFVFCATCL